MHNRSENVTKATDGALTMEVVYLYLAFDKVQHVRLILVMALMGKYGSGWKTG